MSSPIHRLPTVLKYLLLEKVDYDSSLKLLKVQKFFRSHFLRFGPFPTEINELYISHYPDKTYGSYHLRITLKDGREITIISNYLGQLDGKMFTEPYSEKGHCRSFWKFLRTCKTFKYWQADFDFEEWPQESVKSDIQRFSQLLSQFRYIENLEIDAHFPYAECLMEQLHSNIVNVCLFDFRGKDNDYKFYNQSNYTINPKDLETILTKPGIRNSTVKSIYYKAGPTVLKALAKTNTELVSLDKSWDWDDFVTLRLLLDQGISGKLENFEFPKLVLHYSKYFNLAARENTEIFFQSFCDIICSTRGIREIQKEESFIENFLEEFEVSYLETNPTTILDKEDKKILKKFFERKLLNQKKCQYLAGIAGDDEYFQFVFCMKYVEID